MGGGRTSALIFVDHPPVPVLVRHGQGFSPFEYDAFEPSLGVLSSFTRQDLRALLARARQPGSVGDVETLARRVMLHWPDIVAGEKKKEKKEKKGKTGMTESTPAISSSQAVFRLFV